LAAHFHNYSRTENNRKDGRSTCPTAATTLKHDEWEGRGREKAPLSAAGVRVVRSGEATRKM